MTDKRIRWALILLMGSFFFVGLFWHLQKDMVSLAIQITPWVLFFVSALIYALSSGTKQDWYLWSISAFLFTFIAEAVGVATGAVFGAYRYTGVLGFSVFGVPLIIGFNWVMVCAGAMAWVEFLFTGKSDEHSLIKCLIRIILGAFLCTLFDMLLEPVAIRLGYWVWDSTLVPLQNYVAWFVLGLVCCAAFEFFRLTNPAKQSKNTNERRQFYLRGFFLIEVLFFGSLNLAWAVL